MKIVFFGNTKYSAIGLKKKKKKIPISLVVTIPDKPSGRKREQKPTATKQFAKENSIPVLETQKLDENALGKIKNIAPDFLVVEDYGLILPESILEIPKYAPLNIHHSLLPKYRGPSPAPSAILAGEAESGVTVIEMTNEVDAGDILAQVKYTLEKDETTDSLLTTLNKLGAELILDVIENYQSGSEKPTSQNHKEATLTQRLEKQNGHIDIENPPGMEKLDRMIRAYYPWPTVWTEIDTSTQGQETRRIKIKLLPGKLIQPEGKRPMSMKEFLNGYPQTKTYLEKLFDIKSTK